MLEDTREETLELLPLESSPLVAVGFSLKSDVMIVKIYDSSKTLWGIFGHLLENLENCGLSRGIVFSDAFYCITLNRVTRISVLGFNI